MKESNLIKNYIQDNELDIEKVMKKYTPYIYTMLRNKNPNLTNEDIEEIVSDVFLVTWKNQFKLDRDKELLAYLVGVTKNLYNKKIRNKRSARKSERFPVTVQLAGRIRFLRSSGIFVSYIRQGAACLHGQIRVTV